LKFYLVSDLCFFQAIAQKGAHMLQPLGEKTFVLISNALGKVTTLNYSHVLLSTRIGENPTKI